MPDLYSSFNCIDKILAISFSLETIINVKYSLLIDVYFIYYRLDILTL